MCNHVFFYPDDRRENYNHDGKTLTGVCIYCRAKKKALGYRGLECSTENEDDFEQDTIYDWSQICCIDRTKIMCESIYR